MIVNEDLSYLGVESAALQSLGLAKIGVHSIDFRRHFTDEQKEQNLALAKRMSPDEWSAHCEAFEEALSEPLSIIAESFDKEFDVHQFSELKSTNVHYESDWDLFFYSNAGWNGKKYMSYFSLTFNHNRTPESNMELLKTRILPLVEAIQCDSLYCRVQYETVCDPALMSQAAENAYILLSKKFVTVNGVVGRIKRVDDIYGDSTYRFFKKGARSKSTPVSETVLILIANEQGENNGNG